ncbi:hypothetical protein Bhyg_07430 [Pseudolycoriella hygida]|uniref:Uncharacterized protein n=1 Tax=Pseudolycoriella hygida TaxID=35572 RepID=A0A9Q0S2R8_9DIPT|nr:hypothetical protein Bhyg_07430 [Pseudolycoriella hygida]
MYDDRNQRIIMKKGDPFGFKDIISTCNGVAVVDFDLADFVTSVCFGPLIVESGFDTLRGIGVETIGGIGGMIDRRVFLVCHSQN